MNSSAIGLILMLLSASVLAAPADITQPSTVASVAGAAITRAELEARAEPRLATEDEAYKAELHRLAVQHERSRDAISADALQTLVNDRVLERQAKAEGKAVPQLIAALPIARPSQADIRAFYEARKDQVGAPFEIVADAIKEHLDAEAKSRAISDYLTALRQRHAAETHREPLRETVPSGGPSRGTALAPVVLVEFADFQCPYCVKVAPVLGRLREAYGDRLRVEFRQLPLTNLHAEAQRAAEASVCADEQHRFWEVHDALFATQGRFDSATIFDVAGKAGIDMTAFRTCLSSDRGAEVVRRDAKLADELAIGGTPAIFVNGRFVANPGYEELASLVDDELRRAGVPVAATSPR